MIVWIDIILGFAVLILIGIQFLKFKLMEKILASFDNSNDGFSARKLSAFVGVTVSIVATFRFVDTTTIIEALMVWLCFALLCLGIITAEQVIRLRNKGNNDPVIEDQPKSESEESQSIN